ncbi:hypothetical protein [Aquabacterium sp.]|uniref:hypothetical protein n=1 Tax=Aquabacterium sp. TaxID=1872578 RepID=UPI0025C5CB7E|nr:hypothetical protein [Aquabacterium sp.]
MNACPLCGEPHELGQCPRWRVPGFNGFIEAGLRWNAWWIVPYLAACGLVARVGAMA